MNLLSSNNSTLHEVFLNDHLYVDKTAELVNFITHLEKKPRLRSPNIYLMIRPRGFGLSLVSETIEAFISRSDIVHSKIKTAGFDEIIPKAPVVRLSLNKIKANTPLEFKEALIEMLQLQMWEHHLSARMASSHRPKICFLSLLRELSRKYNESVVVLIDNYDIPFFMTQAMDRKYQQEALAIYLDTLNAIKQAGDSVRWSLLSGHVKFDLASEYSEGLPIVKDYSFSPLCDTLFGFSVDEVKKTFKEELKRVSPRLGVTVSEYVQALEAIYGGYTFSDRQKKMLCPYSVGSAIDNGGVLLPYMSNHDYTFLKHCLEAKNLNLDWLFGRDGQDALFLDSLTVNPSGKELGSLLLQLGFVVINKVTRSEGDNFINYRYRFDITNHEMKRILKVFRSQASEELLLRPFNPQVYDDGLYDFDLQ